MSSLLVIDSAPPGLGGHLHRLSSFFIDLYKKEHPEDTVTELILYDATIPFLTKRMIESIRENDKNVRSWVSEFKKYDQYLVISPQWALGVSAILKAYLDLICIPGETFYFDENGQPQGLLTDKKVVIMTSAHTNTPETCEGGDMNANYLRRLFEFLGMKSVVHFGIEGLKTEPERVEPYLSVLKTQIENFIRTF